MRVARRLDSLVAARRVNLEVIETGDVFVRAEDREFRLEKSGVAVAGSPLVRRNGVEADQVARREQRSGARLEAFIDILAAACQLEFASGQVEEIGVDGALG